MTAFAMDVRELALDEIDAVNGAGVDWAKTAKFAGRAAGIGVRLGVWGLAGAAVATVIYVGVEALDGD